MSRLLAVVAAVGLACVMLVGTASAVSAQGCTSPNPLECRTNTDGEVQVNSPGSEGSGGGSGLLVPNVADPCITQPELYGDTERCRGYGL